MSRDTDQRCARAMGWTVQPRTETPTGRTLYELIDPQTKPRPHASYMFTGYYSEAKAWNDVPHFSSDLSAAWTLVEFITRVPQTHEEAVAMRNTRFAYWWKQADLWAYTAKEAAAAIVAAFLAAVETTDGCI